MWCEYSLNLNHFIYSCRKYFSSSHIPFPDEASKMVEPPEILQSFTSSSTATASEQEYQLTIRGNVTKRNVRTPRKRRLKRYVGDLSSDDFSTPRKSKSNYGLMKQVLLL
ncbi:unnamed protein product [Acanthoscelides obtectus]|uniref:Uncharacterized protein n=1 Tax=Acanthoscelides obtectus TaxID=200917 RepID=A0A9P0M8Q0_ACAOB|nr:unnamed protein product [Acanthoscelides obtectus]CAK1652190.1 hypothetical protein AOBTE_LOCUS17726 [Acanthoscelides obtectus]